MRQYCALAFFHLLITFVLAETNSYNNNDITIDTTTCKGCEAVVNVDDEVYHVMAQESMKKFQEDQGFGQYQYIIKVIKVSKQNLTGLLTRINFNAAPADCTVDNNEILNANASKVLNRCRYLSCHSLTTEQATIHNPKIEISCNNQGRIKRHTLGGQSQRNPNSTIYKDIAEESLKKYMKDNFLNLHHEVLQVNNVTEQVVAGIIIRIDFDAKLDFSKVISCHSEIWNRPWLKRKEINVTCVEHHDKQKREIPGGLMEQNINDPIYRNMAEESLIKYMKDNSFSQHHEVLQVQNATTQVVAGIITRIDFDAKLDSSKLISCHSEIWDRPWLNKKEINVTCRNLE